MSFGDHHSIHYPLLHSVTTVECPSPGRYDLQRCCSADEPDPKDADSRRLCADCVPHRWAASSSLKQIWVAPWVAHLNYSRVPNSISGSKEKAKDVPALTILTAQKGRQVLLKKPHDSR